jgi:type I restriction enzyme S subunit
MQDIQVLGSGATFLEVSKTALENFTITFPESLTDQHQIATILKAQLAEVETTRKALETKIHDIEILASRLLDRAFLNPEWRITRLLDVALINPKRTKIQRDDDTQTSFVPMENVDDVNGIVKHVLSRPYAAVKKGYTYFEENDVIFAKITPCMQNGKHAIVSNLIDGIGFGSTEFHVIRCSEKIIPEWVHFFSASPRNS